MKIILTKFVKDLGREGDILDVSDGYAVNSLFPRGLAKQATANILNKYRMAQKSEEIKAEKARKATLSVFEKLDGKIILFEEKLNPKGNLYHSLGLKEIIRAIKEQYHVSTPNNLFKKSYSFKEAGKYTIEMEAYDKTIKLIISIEGK